MTAKVFMLPALIAVLFLLANGTNQAAEGEHFRTWSDRSGEHQTEAGLVDSQDGKVTLKKKDGTTITVSLDSLSDADREYVKHHTPGNDRASEPIEKVGAAAKPKQRGPSSRHGRGGNVAEINFPGGKKAGRPALPEAKEVVVTGVGTNPEKAVQNAFSQAIEQTVGVLVDAETVVKNDQLIRDEVLTYSRGYVDKYEVVKRWQEEGLHHATIRAVVARDKLVEKLRGMKIAMVDVAGELTARQIDFDAKNEGQAAEMFKKALAGFDMTKLTKVEIVGKPEIARNGASAKVRIQVKVSPDRERWKEFSRSLRPILAAIATKRAAVTCKGSETWGPYSEQGRLTKQLEGEGVLVRLFLDMDATGDRTDWEIFRVPGLMEGAIKATIVGKHYQLAYSLLDEQGGEVLRTTSDILDAPNGRWPWNARPIIDGLGNDPWPIGPGWWSTRVSNVIEMEHTLSISSEDLKKVVKMAAVFEEAPKKR